MADHPRDILGAEYYAQLQRDIPIYEAELARATKAYELAVQAGIANAEMSTRLSEAKKRIAQMRAAFRI